MASRRRLMDTMEEVLAQMEELKASWAEEAEQEAREEAEEARRALEAKKASDEALAREAQRAKEAEWAKLTARATEAARARADGCPENRGRGTRRVRWGPEEQVGMVRASMVEEAKKPQEGQGAGGNDRSPFEGWQQAVMAYIRQLPASSDYVFTAQLKGTVGPFVAAIEIDKRFYGRKGLVPWRGEILSLLHKAEDRDLDQQSRSAYLMSPRGPKIRVTLHRATDLL